MDKKTLQLIKNKIDQLENVKRNNVVIPSKPVTFDQLILNNSMLSDKSFKKGLEELKKMNPHELQKFIKTLTNKMNPSELQDFIKTLDKKQVEAC